MRKSKNLKAAFICLVLLLTVRSAGNVAAQQPGSEEGQDARFLEVRIPEFEVHNQTLVDGVWKLARGPAPFGFGFEKLLKHRLSDPDVPDPRLSLRLIDKSVRQILDALCQEDSRYTWSIDDAMVDLFPRAVINDGSYLLNRKLARFELRNATDVQNGLLAIVQQLPPPAEQIAEAQVGGGNPYPPEPWTVTFEDLTVRQVVNRLAAHGGECAVWIFGGANDFRAFGFFNTYLCSRQPLPPWRLERLEPRHENH